MTSITATATTTTTRAFVHRRNIRRTLQALPRHRPDRNIEIRRITAKIVGTTMPTRTRTITTEIETETSNSGGTRIIDGMDSTEARSDTTIGTGKGTTSGDRDTTIGLRSTI
jgi:hypothetical protein